MLNKVLMIGNLVDDPRPLRTTTSGATVTDFRIAVNDPMAKKGDDERTCFIDVTVWNKTAENCVRYLEKGRQVLVEGRLEQDQWEDKETGQRRSKHKVVAFSVTFMGGGQDREDHETAETAGVGAGRSRADELADKYGLD